MRSALSIVALTTNYQRAMKKMPNVLMDGIRRQRELFF
jgi:hypothetical protein